MTSDLNMDYSKYDFKDSTELYVYLSKKGLSRGTVEEISKLKDEPRLWSGWNRPLERLGWGALPEADLRCC